MEHEAQRSFYLGRYNCVEYLGTGPLGDTFRAKIYGVADFEKPFALKRLRRSLGDDEAFLERFMALCRQAAVVDHPRLARLHEVNAQGSRFYVISDFIVGLDLRRILDALAFRSEGLPLDVCLLIAHDVADTIHYLHSLSVPLCHYGISPATIMITMDGHIRVVDPGLCGALIRPGWTDDQTLVPRLGYFAPELLRNQIVDERSDIFALGAVLFELLSNNKAFPGVGVPDVLARMEAMTPVARVQNPELQTLLAQMIRSSPGQRTSSMAEIRDVMQALLGDRIARARVELSDILHRVIQNRPRAVAVDLPHAPRPVTAQELLKRRPLTKTWIPPKAIRTKRDESTTGVDSPLKKLPPTNTFAGLGPHDQIPVEWANLPGTPTERAMPAVDEVGRPIDPLLAEGSVTMEQLRPRSSLSGELYDQEILPDTVRKPHPHADDISRRIVVGPSDGVIVAELHETTIPEPIPAPVFNGMDTGPRLSVPEPMEDLTDTAPLHPLNPMVQHPSSEILLPKPQQKRPWLWLAAGVFALALVVPLLFFFSGSQSSKRVHSVPQKPPVIELKATPPLPVAPAPATPEAGPTATPTAAPSAAPAATPTPTATPSSATVTAAPATKTKPQLVERFSIESTPPGAEIFLDGKTQGKTPLLATLSPGAHKIVAVLDGFLLGQQEVNATDKSEPTVRFILEVAPDKVDQASVKIRCKSRGEFRIMIDGQDTGHQCPNEERIWLSPGAHRLGLYSPAVADTFEKAIHVRAGTSHSTRIYIKNQ